MTALAAGSTVQITVPAGAILKMSGQGTHQTAPLTNARTQTSLITAAPATTGPFPISRDVILMATAGGPGVSYSIGTGDTTKDIVTQDLVTVSRPLAQADAGTIVPVANGVTLTYAKGTLAAFSCIVLPASGASISIAFSGGATGNGAATTIVRTRANNLAGFSIMSDPTTGADAVAVGGA